MSNAKLSVSEFDEILRGMVERAIEVIENQDEEPVLTEDQLNDIDNAVDTLSNLFSEAVRSQIGE